MTPTKDASILFGSMQLSNVESKAWRLEQPPFGGPEVAVADRHAETSMI